MNVWMLLPLFLEEGKILLILVDGLVDWSYGKTTRRKPLAETTRLSHMTNGQSLHVHGHSTRSSNLHALDEILYHPKGVSLPGCWCKILATSSHHPSPNAIRYVISSNWLHPRNCHCCNTLGTSRRSQRASEINKRPATMDGIDFWGRHFLSWLYRISYLAVVSTVLSFRKRLPFEDGTFRLGWLLWIFDGTKPPQHSKNTWFSTCVAKKETGTAPVLPLNYDLQWVNYHYWALPSVGMWTSTVEKLDANTLYSYICN